MCLVVSECNFSGPEKNGASREDFPSESLSVMSRDLVTFGKSCDDDESSPLPVSWRGLAAHAEQVVDESRPGTEPVLCGAHLRVQSVGRLGSYGW